MPSVKIPDDAVIVDRSLAGPRRPDVLAWKATARLPADDLEPGA